MKQWKNGHSCTNNPTKGLDPRWSRSRRLIQGIATSQLRTILPAEKSLGYGPIYKNPSYGYILKKYIDLAQLLTISAE